MSLRENHKNGRPRRAAKTGPGPERIAVLGMGHVGLPTALGFAEMGWNVIGADSDRDKIARLQRGDVFFHEMGLPELLNKHHSSGQFQLTHDIDAAIRQATILFICVGTPQKENGEADLSQVDALARTIARNLNGYKLIIEKSTVPAITGQWIRRTVTRYATAHLRSGNGSANSESQAALDSGKTAIDFDVASNPEFLQEGTALEDFFHPARIVCGVESKRAHGILARLYRPLKCPIVFTDVNTAELIKHTANAFLATKISFINMVADVCERINADVNKVAEGIGLDPRIGKSFLNAGLGFGGYCLPKDLRALIHLAEQHNVDAGLLRATERINLSRIDHLMRKIRQALWLVRGKTIGVLGLAFKPHTDDVREAPSLQVIRAILAEGGMVRLYDPKAMDNCRALLPEEPGRITYCATPYEVARDAHAVLMLTEWPEFLNLDLAFLRRSMAVPVLIDARNSWDLEKVRKAGFEYLSLGGPSQQPNDLLPAMSTKTWLQAQNRLRSVRATAAGRSQWGSPLA